VAEGRFVVERLLQSGRYQVRAILSTRTAFEALRTRLGQLPTAPALIADQSLLDAIVGFQMHRGCVALAVRPPLDTLEDLALHHMRRVVVMERVGNPDNVGGIFRSAAAFDADLVVLGPGCGDPYYRKAIRTSMAATLDVKCAAAAAWPAGLQTLRRSGLRVLGLCTDAGSRPIDSLPPIDGAAALLVGNEGDGLTRDALAACDDLVRIPISSRVDSLNVTVAASIAMHRLFSRGDYADSG
jgi:tRNA G18 (ribose-2'-O)-methylase SpoU